MTRYRFMAAIMLVFACETSAIAGSYTEFRQVLVDAIDHGSAYGVLRDDLADRLTTQLHANGPVYVAARPVSDLSKAGCKRLSVDFDIRGVQMPQGETGGRLNLKMNYCKDGTPPISLDRKEMAQ
ncbi:hypothetical protein KEX41_29565 (plasmid) [Burkholderia thailandensis]|nr:hypothetical protein [Burkholderia thailandensis]QRA15139.1 hypothetical protein JMY07_29990 [Burkholderia thailandensis]